MFKKIAVVICVIFLLFTGCGKKENSQLTNSQSGEVTGTMKTDMGDIKFKLFPTKAPKAVENFVKLSEKGYYDGLTFHRVINEFMIQGGDPDGTGRGGESIWGKPFEDEIDKDLHYFRGTLAMANSGPNTNGSQFFIIQKKSMTNDDVESMKQNSFDKKLIEEYTKLGGAPWLEKGFTMTNGYKSTGYTIFGQVYEGMEVVDKIAGVKVDENAKPEKDVKILSMQINNK